MLPMPYSERKMGLLVLPRSLMIWFVSGVCGTVGYRWKSPAPRPDGYFMATCGAPGASAPQWYSHCEEPGLLTDPTSRWPSKRPLDSKTRRLSTRERTKGSADRASRKTGPSFVSLSRPQIARLG